VGRLTGAAFSKVGAMHAHTRVAVRCTPAPSPAAARVPTRRPAALQIARACGQCEQADRRGSAAASPPLLRRAAATDEASCSSSARGGADGSGQSLDATAAEVVARSDASASSSERERAESLGVRAALAALMFYKGARRPPSWAASVCIAVGRCCTCCHYVSCACSLPARGGAYVDCACLERFTDATPERCSHRRSCHIASAAKVVPLPADVLRIQHARVPRVWRRARHRAHRLAPAALQPAVRGRLGPAALAAARPSVALWGWRVVRRGRAQPERQRPFC